MSQNSLTLATSGTLSGLAAVQAINQALDTLNTLASGASAPSSPEAGQFWHDTTNNILKLRSLDNTTWMSVAAINESTYKVSAIVQPAPSIYGLMVSNDTSTPNSVIDVAPGGAADSTVTVYMRLAAAMKKNVTAAWSVGSTGGCLDTGTIQSSKFYHLHLIYDASTSAVDLLSSLSYSNPSLPTGYGYFVPIGAFYMNSGGNIMPFVQDCDEFLYSVDVSDATSASVSSAATVNLMVPSGTKVTAKFRCFMESAYSGGAALLLFQCPDQSATTPSTQNASLACDIYTGAADSYASGEFGIRTNTSGQIRVSSNLTGGVANYSIDTMGFVYRRGAQ